jgi:hypothetical protein
MSASGEGSGEIPAGYRFDQLAAVFDRVMNPRDWQAPICSVIPAVERELVETAVRCFTDTVPTFEPAPGTDDRLVITAAGYRQGKATS